jgi:hypothetical protein
MGLLYPIRLSKHKPKGANQPVKRFHPKNGGTKDAFLTDHI